MKNTTQKIVISSMFAALVCVATMLIKIPSPLKGYINLGDGIVLLAAWILPLPYGMAAAGLGSALADLFSGYVVYAPATFIIKALMAVVAYSFYKLFAKKTKSTGSRILSGVLAELVMICEEKFGVEIADEDSGKFVTVGDVVTYLESL